MSLKLHYFDTRGSVQIPLLVAAYGEVPVEWVKLKHSEWPGELKAKTPFGQLPYLEDGPVILAQNFAIARYLARKGKLEGSTDRDFAASEQLYEETADILKLVSKSYQQEGDKLANLKKIFETELPKHLEALEKLIIESSGHFTAGPKLVGGEVAIFAMLSLGEEVKQDLFDATPKLKKFCETTHADPKFKSYFDANHASFLTGFLPQKK